MKYKDEDILVEGKHISPEARIQFDKRVKGMARLFAALYPELLEEVENGTIGTHLCRICKTALEEGQRGKRCKRCIGLTVILDKYALTFDEYISILEDQDYKCAICNDKLQDSKSTHVDHCHRLSHVRGILCSRCNTGLGYFKDNPARLKAAIRYLLENEVIRTWWIQKLWEK